MVIELRTGVKKDGTLVARECKAVLDGGAYNSIGPTTTMVAGIFSLLPYRFPNYRYQGYRVYTNNTPSGPMRGHGAIQPVFASESQLDMIAEDLGIDPVELRLKNAVQPGHEVPGLTAISSCGFTECIQRVAQSTGWAKKRGKLPNGRGIGIGCYSYVSGGAFNWFDTSLPFSEVIVKLNEDGTVNVFTQAADIGQGSDTVLSQIAAEELGVHLEDIRIIVADTEITPVDLGSWSSRVTLHAGNATKAAAADAKRQLFEVARVKLELKVHQDLEAKDRRIYVKGFPERALSFSELVSAAQRANDGSPIMGRGTYTPRGRGLITPAFSFGAQVAEVEVDKETGNVKVLKVTTAHDCGKAINPLSVEGQLEGSVHMALGYALSEQLLTERGKTLNPSFLDYRVFTAVDMPEIESIVVETYEPEGPFGAKEAGEGLTLPTAAAIATAIYDAVGVRVTQLPVTPEKIAEALSE